MEKTKISYVNGALINQKSVYGFALTIDYGSVMSQLVFGIIQWGVWHCGKRKIWIAFAMERLEVFIHRKLKVNSVKFFPFPASYLYDYTIFFGFNSV
mgnify:CR=1 FL=1